ncbi:beta-N-acetylhexosaminidase [Desulfonema ishimotonii]|uniref:beta-N-acetylhexosaminidase n=1 Tax=Desulfonema ishimotonii TaxID=45657 RepID=A0A401FRX5_9BACT|nr:beta-N-acetylhexosaminidase [Desulfonema ishimotonii]GBC59703.1 beta-N-acetylhexosaminidase [Desulfonema ishimotonii]
MDVSGFSDEQLAGQRLMVGFDGTEPNENLNRMIREIRVGGLILFARNVGTPDQLRNLCASAQACAADCGQPPLFIAIDQEGGQVARLRAPLFTEFPGNPAMKNVADAEHFARVTAAELSAAGINMNMAPVMDIAPAGMESIMAGRAFGHDPAWVSRLGCKVIDTLQAGGVMAVAKHFPGIGRTTLDSHADLPVMDADMADISAFDLIPFEAAIARNVAGIMLSHILYRAVDPAWPASLSPEIARKHLRDRLGFDGLVITDDLDMGAIHGRFSMDAIVRQILAAEIDITLICHQGSNIGIAFEQILKHLRESPDIRQRGLAAVRRISAFKQAYGIWTA